MMLRTPPCKQKRSSPAGSPLITSLERDVAVAEIHTSSPSKRPRLPFDINVEEVDEPFALRSLRRGRSRDERKIDLLHSQPCPEELAVIHGRGVSYLRDPEGVEDLEPELDWENLRCSYKCRNLVKSDVLVSLDAREKEVGELKGVARTLEVAYSTAEEEKKKLRHRVELLEQNLAAASEREKAGHKQRLQETDKMEELVRTHVSRCAQLENLLQEQMRKCAEAEASALSLEARASTAEDAREKDNEKSAREMKRYQSEVQKLREDYIHIRDRMNIEVEMERKRGDGARAETEKLQLEFDKLKEFSEKNLEQLKQEHRLLDVEIQNNALKTTGTTESELVIKHLKEELRQCEQEVSEARKVKRFYANVDLLKERIESEKQRADSAEAALTKVGELEWKVKNLESELSEWKELLVKIPGVESRTDIVLKFGELQRDLVSAVAKTGEANAQVLKVQTALDMAKSAKDESDSLLSAGQAELLEANLNLKRAERKLSLITKERDGLKEILASYDEEEAVIASQQARNPSSDVSGLSTPTKSKDLRIQQLEEALADAQQHAKVLTEELERGSDFATDQRHRAETLDLQLTEERDRIKMVDRENEQLRLEVSTLTAKVGSGEWNPATTKVLHLLSGLQTAERNAVGCRDEYSPSNSTELESVNTLQQRISALEKREVRYKQVFGNKIALFRESCGLIFGYKVQMTEEQDSSTGASVTLFTIRSIYSSSEDEQIQFQFKAGTLEMIENEYTASPDMQRQMLITDGRATLGSLDTATSVQHPADAEHWFVCDEDEASCELVLRSLLCNTEVNDTDPTAFERKPRRTWLRDYEPGEIILARQSDDSDSDDFGIMITETSRDVFCQFPDKGLDLAESSSRPLWNFAHELSPQSMAVDVLCQYPETVEPDIESREAFTASRSSLRASYDAYESTDATSESSDRDLTNPSIIYSWKATSSLPQTMVLAGSTTSSSKDIGICQATEVHDFPVFNAANVTRYDKVRNSNYLALPRGSRKIYEPSSSDPVLAHSSKGLSELKPTRYNLRAEQETLGANLHSKRPRPVHGVWESLLRRLVKVKFRFRLRPLSARAREQRLDSSFTESTETSIPFVSGEKVYKI